MKPHSTIFLLTAVIIIIAFCPSVSAQQQYKLRQSSGMMGMKSESIIYVKGMQKRTESGGYMGQTNNLVTIEQCDKQRMITLNVKKKLYLIEPFANDAEEVIDEDAKVIPKPKTIPVTIKKGGIINMYYNITDTGERKKMYGFTARHIWTTQKIKPSPDACTMKDSMIIKTDGWYIDLPEFNCPVRYKPYQANNGGYQQPDCKDRYITRRSGKGKLGFPLIEKRTIIMGNGQPSSSEFVTDLETLELITGKLDSMLFEIPPGYAEVKKMSELEDKLDAGDMMKQYMGKDKTEDNKASQPPGEKEAGTLRIGVYEPKTDGQLQAEALQQYLVTILNDGTIAALAVSSEEEAKSKNCDLVLNTDFVKMKQASKVGGLLKVIKNSDPNAASSFNIEANMVLAELPGGGIRTSQNINGKYDGKANDAAKKALDEGARLVLKAINK